MAERSCVLLRNGRSDGWSLHAVDVVGGLRSFLGGSIKVDWGLWEECHRKNIAAFVKLLNGC